MSLNKSGYFQGGGGVNEPEPKKKKYKSEPALVVQPRFKEPFYRNYDLYNTPGEHSPGAGWHDMEKYKSVQEFLKAKRKKLKDKYKPDDSWQIDSGKRVKKKKKASIEARSAIFERIIKNAEHDSNDIDFPIDDQVSIISHEEGEVPGSQIGGRHTVPKHDLLDRSPEALNFGREHDHAEPARGLHEDILQKLFNKYLTPTETGLFGLPDGIDPEGHDADQTEQVEEPFTGTSDIGTQMYEDKWNI